MSMDIPGEGVRIDFASMAQSFRAANDGTCAEAKQRKHQKKKKSRKYNSKKDPTLIEEEELTPEEEALRKQRKDEKKRSKLRQKYEMESLRETYETLQDENEYLKTIIRTHIHPSAVAHQIISESEALRAAFFDTSKEQLKAHLAGAVGDDGSTVVASGNAIRRKSFEMQKDATSAEAVAAAANELRELKIDVASTA